MTMASPFRRQTKKQASGPPGCEEMRACFSTPSLTRWVEPGKELNKLGYYRVMRSVLVYKDLIGRSRELAVITMISWRGEW